VATATVSSSRPAATSTRAVPAPAPLRPATALDRRRLGAAAYSAGDVAGSLEQFQHAVDADPTDPEALNNLGQLLVKMNRAAEALPHFSRAIEIAPDHWAYRFNRARAYGELQQWSAAVAGYRDALQIFPDDYVTQFNLAKALQRSGDVRAALDGFERAITLAPGQADFHLSHGLALEADQRPGEAAAAYRRYLELADASPESEKVKQRVALLDGPAVPSK